MTSRRTPMMPCSVKDLAHPAAVRQAQAAITSHLRPMLIPWNTVAPPNESETD